MSIPMAKFLLAAYLLALAIVIFGCSRPYYKESYDPDGGGFKDRAISIPNLLQAGSSNVILEEYDPDTNLWYKITFGQEGGVDPVVGTLGSQALEYTALGYSLATFANADPTSPLRGFRPTQLPGGARFQGLTPEQIQALDELPERLAKIESRAEQLEEENAALSGELEAQRKANEALAAASAATTGGSSDANE